MPTAPEVVTETGEQWNNQAMKPSNIFRVSSDWNRQTPFGAYGYIIWILLA